MTNAPRTLVLTLAAMLLVAPMAAAAPTLGTTMTDTATPTATPTESGSVSPGEKLSGVVSVQRAELAGEVAERTYGVTIARANSSGAKAAVVADTVDDVQERVETLERRKETLKEARRNGSISEGKYRAEMAEVAAELSTARRLANASSDTAAGLPEDVLRERGINVTAIQALQDRAANLTGPEVASIARSIAGESVGKSIAGAQKPSEVGKQMPDRVGNRTGGGPPGDTGGAPNGSDGGPPGDTGGAPNGTDGGPNGTAGGSSGSDGRP
jgi:hypothetical protein